jgi:M6 family metalloprotease-like protein
MKRIVVIAALAFVSVLASAVPADKTKFLYRQPDGTVITLQRHGDEFYHWTTDGRGRIMQRDKKGFYVASSMSEAVHRANIRKASSMHRSIWSSYDNPPVTNFGDRKVLCIIANFSDSTFVIQNPRDKFEAMLNQSGYNYNSAIGSVRDYYIDNSNGLYRPSFDVYGPVTLTKSSAHYDNYDGEGGSVAEAIMEAYELLKDQININDYDTDNDGNIDMVLFYYPGHNEAEGAGEESIWPHQSTANYGSMGGKNLNRYFCTSELRGSKGNTMCSIGTTCHEFAHSLGLPDFYDTDYKESGGENANTTGQYDLMTSGCYNDLGRRPPYLGAVERNMLGWMEAPQEITESGDYVLESVSQNKAYMSSSKTEGEYFVYEYRSRSGWDSGLTEGGLLVYHIDKSKNKVPGSSLTAYQLWEYTNKINCFNGHPCYYLLESSSGSYVFPGPNGVSSLELTTWDGQSSGLYLSGISNNGSKVSFKANITEGRSVLGMVKDTDGNPMAGVRVVLSKAAYEFQAPSLLKDDIVTTTDNTGCYQFTLPSNYASIAIITASADGYIPISMNLKLSERYTGQDITMVRLGQEIPSAIRRYEPGNAVVSTFQVKDLLLAMKYTSSEVKEYVGGTIRSISFIPYADTYTDAYVTVDFGTQRALTKKVTSLYQKGVMVTVDITADNIKIPSGKDVYIGFGLTGLDETGNEYNILVYPSADGNSGNYWSSNVTAGPSNWGRYNFGENVFYIPAIEAVIGLPLHTDFSMLGVSYIQLENNVPVVYPASGKTVKEVSWTFNGTPVDNPPSVASFSADTVHTYVATIIYYDGTSEKVIYDYVK